jgi:hypothetical protein
MRVTFIWTEMELERGRDKKCWALGENLNFGQDDSAEGEAKEKHGSELSSVLPSPRGWNGQEGSWGGNGMGSRAEPARLNLQKNI